MSQKQSQRYRKQLRAIVISRTFLFSIIGWGGSIVFYNSFLPEIATKDEYDQLSAKGFALGYIGSVILLLQNLSMLLLPKLYGNISSELASRISFLSVGIWWLVFAQIPLHYLPDNQKSLKLNTSYLTGGFKELRNVFIKIRRITSIKLFLISFFTQSVLAMLSWLILKET